MITQGEGKMTIKWLQNQFELSRGEANGNVRPMEGLRGFAVLLVFVVHYVTLIEPWLSNGTDLFSLSRSLHTIGNSGVDLFFVLSGYLIYGSLISRQQKFLPFIRRRVQRIYPVFIIVFLIYIALSWIFPSENKVPPGLRDAFLYLCQNFLLLPGLLPVKPLITVAWSLSYEMFYYISLPLIISLLKLRQRSVNCRVYIFSALAVVFAIASAHYGGPTRLLMFMSGILLYEVTQHRLFSASGSRAGIIALLAGLISPLASIDGSFGVIFKTGCLFAAFFVICHTCFERPLGALGRAFSSACLRWLGNMSYSYYLVHGLALKAAFLILGKLVPPNGQGILFFVAMMIMMFIWTLIPSAVTFIVIERPFSLDSKRQPKCEGIGGRKKFGEAYLSVSRNAHTSL
jgi:exopolysaccharide production protein ExoZ